MKERLQELAVLADLADPSTAAASLLLIYNGALSSPLRGAPAEPLTSARDLARDVVESSRRRRH